MNKADKVRMLADAPTRREVMSGGVVAFAGLALGSARAVAQQTLTETQIGLARERPPRGVLLASA